MPEGPLPVPADHPRGSADRADYDVIILGGALSGAATALQLLEKDPRLHVVVVERSAVFERRVGESTVEVSSYFLNRVLGLTWHLNREHLVKQGLRFWFHNDRAESLEDCSEIGSRFQVRLPAYQVDRAVLDEEVLRRAAAAGAEVRRPARVVGRVELQPGGWQRVTIRPETGRDHGETGPGAPLPETAPAVAAAAGEEVLRARWVVDASGVAALLARQQGWWRPNPEHPTAAVWARWQGVRDWDTPEVMRRHPELTASCYGLRSLATNHLFGDGWWAWWIPLKDGDVSIGLVYDQRLVRLPAGGSLGERLKTFLTRHPVARELLADARCQEGDVHYRKNLPYFSTVFAGDGFALVGDAAGFIDPFYSPGMDWIAFTTCATVELILAERRADAARPLHDRLERHNRDFARCYRRWFEAIYQDKYEYLGEFDLMRMAFLLDLGLYYLFVASQPYRRGPAALTEPMYTLPPSVPFYHFMRFANRRFAALARSRRERGVYGRHNVGRRLLVGGFTFSPASARPIAGALARWGWLELTEGWRSWGRPVVAAPAGAAPAVAG